MVCIFEKLLWPQARYGWEGARLGTLSAVQKRSALKDKCYESLSAGESSSGKTSQKFPLMWALKDERTLVGGRACMYKAIWQDHVICGKNHSRKCWEVSWRKMAGEGYSMNSGLQLQDV